LSYLYSLCLQYSTCPMKVLLHLWLAIPLRVPQNDCSTQLECYKTKKDLLLRQHNSLSSFDQLLLSKGKQFNLPSHHYNSLVITLEREYWRVKENLKHSIFTWVFSSLVSLLSKIQVREYKTLSPHDLFPPLGGYTWEKHQVNAVVFSICLGLKSWTV